MWLLALAEVASAATLHLESDAAVQLSVADERATLVPGRPTELGKVDGGAWRIEIRSGDEVAWAGDLAFPDDAEVWLAWRGGALVLVRASRLAGADAASGATRAANTLMSIGAGIGAAQDVAAAGSAASSDFDAARSGEAVQSSDTRAEVSVGPGGVQSSTSRTTTGDSGLHHESSSTSIGPDGVSRDTTAAHVDATGASYEQDSDRVARIEVPGEDDPLVVTLARVDVGAAAPTTATARAADEPKSLWYREPAAVDASGSRWTFLDPVAEASEFKLQVRIAATGDAGIVWDPATASGQFDGADVASRGGKPVAVVPGGEDRHTLGFAAEFDLRADAPVLTLGQASRVAKGADVGLGTVDAAPGATVSSGSLACTVKSATVSKASTAVTVECANTGADWAWLWPAAATIDVGTGAPVANAARKQDPVLVGPGSSEKVSIDAPVGTKDPAVVPVVHLVGVGLTGVATPLDLAPVTLAVDPERTADEN